MFENRTARLHALFFFSILTSLLLGTAERCALAQSEYAQPTFDPEHSGAFTSPDERIDTFSGSLNLIEKDLVLPGPNGFDLEIVRWYSSKINQWDTNDFLLDHEIGPLGLGWQMHFGRLWDNPDETDPVPAFKLELPGGVEEPFYNNNRLGVPNADYISPGGWSLRYSSCVGAAGFCHIATSPSGIEYHFPDNITYRMDPDNSYLYVATILDPVGNRITVEYDFGCNCNQAYVRRVTDTWGRQVEFFYTSGEEGEKRCSLDAAVCNFDADCQDRCSGGSAEPCTFDTDCGEGTCSDDGHLCNNAQLDCDRNCSNNPNVTCSADIQCGTRRCVGGSNPNQPCSFNSQCGGVCQGGGNPGTTCSLDSQCTDVCQGGDSPGATCYTNSNCGGVCQGGEKNGLSCDRNSDCSSVCQNGGNPGASCSMDSQCTDVCQGGANPGAPCSSDTFCTGGCQGGDQPGSTCYGATYNECGGICVYGFDHGNSCDEQWECRGVCSDNRLMPCRNDLSCPGGYCFMGSCVLGTCNKGTCNFGTCDEGICVQGTCLIGTCALGTCPPAPTCNPQPTCDNPGECLDSVCLPGTTGPRFLDRITVAWINGTAIYNYTVDEGSFIHPTLGAVEKPTGQTTSYDYRIDPGQTGHDIELKKITLPTGGTIEYAYSDHYFFYPLRNTLQNEEHTRVVTSKKVGSDTWTFSYPSGHPNDRVTVMTDPAGNEREYYYFRYSDDGDNRIWKAGLLERFRIIDGTTVLVDESNTYQPQMISYDNVSTKTGYTEGAIVGRISEKNTTLRGSLTSQVQWGSYDKYGNSAWMLERNWDGTIYRQQEYEYAHSSAIFEQNHIVDRQTVLRVKASGTKAAETITVYDTDSIGGNAFGNPDHVDVWTGSTYITTSYKYDANGDPTEVKKSGEGVSRTTNLTYEHGVLKTLVREGRTIFDRTIDPNSSLVLAERNSNNQTTSFSYDNGSRLTVIDPPGEDLPTTIAYGAKTITANRGSGQSIYSYDGVGRLKMHQTKIDSETSSYKLIDYDGVGNVVHQYEPSLSPSPTGVSTFTRDGLGRVESVAGPDGTTTFSYTANEVTINDGISDRTITNDAFGRVVKVREGSFLTEYEYDVLDNLVRVRHPSAIEDRVFVWRADGLLTSESHPESGMTQYGYNGVGEKSWKEDADGDREYYNYDDEGRMTQIDRPGTDNDVNFYYDGDPVPGHDADYENASGEFSGMTDAAGSSVWSRRDDNGRVLQVERKRGVHNFVTEMEYDEQGNLQRLDYPHSAGLPFAHSIVTYTYNDAGLVTGVQLNGNPIVDNVGYNGLHSPVQWDYSNGVIVHAPTAETERNRPTEIYTVGATRNGEAADIDLVFYYNARGQITSIDFNGRNDSYQYEPARGFLTRVSYDGMAVDFSYDADGNMTHRSSTAYPNLNFSRTHNKNRIIGCHYTSSGNVLSCAGRTYTYWSNNRIRTSDNMVRFTFDGKDRLSETFILGEDRILADFYAEPFGRLTRFTDQFGEGLKPQMDWIYAAGELVATVQYGSGGEAGDTLRLRRIGLYIEFTWSNQDECKKCYQVKRSFYPQFSFSDILGDDLVEPYFNNFLGANGGSTFFYLVDSGSHCSVRWYVSDHRGSTLLVLDQNGEVVENPEYFPFGESKTASGCPNLEGLYQGSLKDQYANLYDLGSRHHSPALARFLVPDVIWPDLRFPSRWNLYLYSANDPVNFLDQLGYATVTKNGGINYLRNVDLYDDPHGWKGGLEIAVNTVGGTISDLLAIDVIADGVSLAGDSTNSLADRVWGGTKALGVATFDAVGGVVVKRFLGGVLTKAKNLFRLTDEFAEVASKTVGKVENLAPRGARFVTNAAGETRIFLRGAEGTLEISNHAAWRITQRGLSLDAVEGVISTQKPFQYFHNGVWKTGFYDPASQVFVGSVDGTITTVITGATPNYINNLLSVMP